MRSLCRACLAACLVGSVLAAAARAAEPEPLTVDALYDANRLHALKSDTTWVDGGMVEDIHLWRRRLASHFEFRAMGNAPAPIDRVLAVILDQNHAKPWLEGSVECFIIEEKVFGNFIAYNRNGSPALFVDGRDSVSELTTTMFPDSRAVRVDIINIDDARKPPREGTVRMPLVNGFWLLREVDARHTEITYQLALDPGGHLPNFLVNLASRDVPAKTIKALREHLADPAIAPFHARVLKKLDWSGYGLSPAMARD